MTSLDRPLACIACGELLKSVFDREGYRHQPSRAATFTSYGNYGSTVWDPMGNSKYLMINVCDACLTEFKERVCLVKIAREEVVYDYQPWDPTEER